MVAFIHLPFRRLQMFIRLMMFVFAAATLLASPFNAHACPDHEAAQTAVLYAPVVSLDLTAAIAPAVSQTCHVDVVKTPCGKFHLCCVTPPGAPAPDCSLETAFAGTGPVTSTGPADTSISLKRATPPPRA